MTSIVDRRAYFVAVGDRDNSASDCKRDTRLSLIFEREFESVARQTHFRNEVLRAKCDDASEINSLWYDRLCSEMSSSSTPELTRQR